MNPGKYRFTANDLHLLSGVYGVNLLGLMKPGGDVTHIRVGRSQISADDYVYDFFIDPRGRFLDRARDINERNSEGTRDIVDALADVEDHLGEKGRIGDLHTALERHRNTVADLLIERGVIETREEAPWKTTRTERNPDDGIN